MRARRTTIGRARRWNRTGRLAAPALAMLALVVVLLLSPGDDESAKAKPASKPKETTVAVSVDRAHPGAAVPQEFLGLSFEMSALAQIARYSDRGNLATMLRSLGPGQLRFGGASADTRIAWTDARTPRPAWATNVVDGEDMRQLAALASASGWHVVLTVGIVHFEPTAAAREIAAAKAALGGWLVGVEIGNEPDSYARHAARSEPWGFSQYAQEAATYRAAIEAAAPGVPLYGPDVSGSAAFESWGPGEAVTEQPAMLTGHHYPLGCAQVPPPSITRLLSAKIRAKEVSSLRRYVRISRAGNLPFRMDETNSVSCGGVADISNTYASALWASGFIAQAMASGAAGVNMHGNPTNCKGYSPVCAPGPQELSTGELTAQPEWYALLLAKELIGSRPLPTAVKVRPQVANVQASGFLAPDASLRFVLVDYDPLGKPAVSVRLRVGTGYSRARTLALTGQSLDALSGTQLGESEVGADGSWTARRVGAAAARGGTVSVKLAAGSAALVTVSPKAG
ncbi:MAG TPA: hypothetical protein VGO29_01830 [Solirubrobacteraceae bacterium]|nr:hypothetical protein [Solirubrobacteraceae bacterium]